MPYEMPEDDGSLPSNSPSTESAPSDRFCKDCIWSDYGPGKELHPIATECLHPSSESSKLSLVTGEVYYFILTCWQNRNISSYTDSDKACGIEGRFWELREDT